MVDKGKNPQKFQVWVDARRKYHLSDEHIQMARELGMNPKKFGSLANSRQESWKLPLPEFIQECYQKRFGKEKPEQIISIEQKIEGMRTKKMKKDDAKIGA